MSVLNKVYCDHCAAEIFAGRTLLFCETGPLRDRWGAIDLCGGCARLFMEWLDEHTHDPERDSAVTLTSRHR